MFNYLSRSFLSHTGVPNNHGSWYSSASNSSSSFMNVDQSTHYQSTSISSTPSISISLDLDYKTILSTIVSELHTLNMNFLDMHRLHTFAQGVTASYCLVVHLSQLKCFLYLYQTMPYPCQTSLFWCFFPWVLVQHVYCVQW